MKEGRSAYIALEGRWLQADSKQSAQEIKK
jgi:hypothetical protein